MSKRKKTILFSIIFLAIGIVIIIPFVNFKNIASIIGLLSLILGTVGSIMSIFIPTSYSTKFSENDWQYDEGDESYFLKIQASKHGLGMSNDLSVYEKINKKYEVVDIAHDHDENGNITIKSNSKFEGKIIVK